jgi:hypothetical protein
VARRPPALHINQDHKPHLRFGTGLSRRLGTSRVRGSAPRSARRRSYAAWRTKASSCRTAGQPSLFQEAVIDIEGFPHIIDADKSMTDAALHRK